MHTRLGQIGFLSRGWGHCWIVVMHDPASAIERIIQDIERAISVRLYYPALLMTLTLPEICMGLTLQKSNFVKRDHYVSFVDNYTTEGELGLDGASCYQLRGGLVHRADLTGHAYFPNTHVVFTVPETHSSIHALSIISGDKSASMFDLQLFCAAMIKAARAWYDEVVPAFETGA